MNLVSYLEYCVKIASTISWLTPNVVWVNFEFLAEYIKSYAQLKDTGTVEMVCRI